MDRNSCLVVGESVSGIEIVLRNLCNFFMLYYIVNLKKAKQKTNKHGKVAWVRVHVPLTRVLYSNNVITVLKTYFFYLTN